MRERLKRVSKSKPNDPPQVLWNFEKFVVGKEWRMWLARFLTQMWRQNDPRLVAVIEAELRGSNTPSPSSIWWPRLGLQTRARLYFFARGPLFFALPPLDFFKRLSARSKRKVKA